MTRPRRILPLLALLAAVVGASSHSRPAVARQAVARQTSDPAALVKQLGSTSFSEREKATEALEKLGEPALPELRKALFSKDDLEVRRRAGRIILEIERRLYGEQQTLSAEAGSVNGVALSPDGKRALSGDNRGVRLWDLASGKQLAFLDDHGDRVMAVAFFPDGKSAVSASEDRTARVWDLGTRKERFLLKGHTAAVRALALAPDGRRVATAGFDGNIILWDTATGKRLTSYPTPGARLFALAWSPDGRSLAVAGDGHLSLWDLGREKARVLSGHTGLVMGVAFTPDGKRLLSCGHDKTVRLWEVSSGKQVGLFKEHAAEVCCVAVSADGKRAASAGLDKVVRVWELDGQRELRALPGHDKAVWSVAIGPDGVRGLTGGADGEVKEWRLGR